MDWEIDRNALVEFHKDSFYRHTRESVARGELTFSEAAVVYRKFIESDILQKLADADVDQLTATLNGQVH